MATSLCIAQISQSAQKGQQSRLVTSIKNHIYTEQLVSTARVAHAIHSCHCPGLRDATTKGASTSLY